MKILISVAIISFNEERNIARCINSVKEFADEIVVIDSFSTDKTVEIAKDLGAKVINQKFLGYIEQKNFAITQCAHKIVFSIDSDEAPDERLKKSILEVKNNFDAAGYSMNRLTNYCGKWIRHCGWYPDVKLRLWVKDKGEWGGKNPHDEFIMDKESKVKHLKGNLLHYSYYSINQHSEQISNFTDISSLLMFEKGKNASLIELFIGPMVSFMRNYVLKLGFLDGFYGLVVCGMTAHSKFLKMIKLRALNLETKK
ncbi:MAG: glycosyltransferase involved in cell wall biosynthesis [Sphingobacteriales bacterium]|jgi:glycosyltransferase involved in cell wall biosynthesis